MMLVSETLLQQQRDKRRRQESEDGEGEGVYECRFCSKKYTKSQALGGHMNSHRQEREVENFLEAARTVMGREIGARAFYERGLEASMMTFLNNSDSVNIMGDLDASRVYPIPNSFPFSSNPSLQQGNNNGLGTYLYPNSVPDMGLFQNLNLVTDIKPVKMENGSEAWIPTDLSTRNHASSFSMQNSDSVFGSSISYHQGNPPVSPYKYTSTLNTLNTYNSKNHGSYLDHNEEESQQQQQFGFGSGCNAMYPSAATVGTELGIFGHENSHPYNDDFGGVHVMALNQMQSYAAAEAVHPTSQSQHFISMDVLDKDREASPLSGAGSTDADSTTRS